MRLSSPEVGTTRTTSSPSRRLIAIHPSRRDLSYSLNAVFFTVPFLVPNTKNLSVGKSRVEITA